MSFQLSELLYAPPMLHKKTPKIPPFLNRISPTVTFDVDFPCHLPKCRVLALYTTFSASRHNSVGQPSSRQNWQANCSLERLPYSTTTHQFPPRPVENEVKWVKITSSLEPPSASLSRTLRGPNNFPTPFFKPSQFPAEFPNPRFWDIYGTGFTVGH